MQELDLLINLRPLWLDRAWQVLAHGSNAHEDIRPMLERIFDLLIQAAKTGDPAWLDPILTEWAASLTQTDLEGSSSHLTRLIKEISLMTYTVIRQNLPERPALDLMGLLMPCFVDGRKLPGFFEVTICDTGIGIAPDDSQVIFEKFVRLGNTSLHSSSKIKFKGGGPGLGLRIAKGILESHGGAIWVESHGYDEKLCPGSTFHLLIPMRTVSPDARMARLFASMGKSNQKRRGLAQNGHTHLIL